LKYCIELREVRVVRLTATLEPAAAAAPPRRTLSFACSLCGRRVTVVSPPARLLLLYGPSAAEARPICADCDDSVIARPAAGQRRWVKTIGGF